MISRTSEERTTGVVEMYLASDIILLISIATVVSMLLTHMMVRVAPGSTPFRTHFK